MQPLGQRPHFGPLLMPRSHATSLMVTRLAGDSDFSRDWDAVRADGDIQFAPVEIPPEIPPPESSSNWLVDLFEWIAWAMSPLAELVGGNWLELRWVLLALVVALILYAIWRLVGPVLTNRRIGADDDADFAPARSQALQLLEEADRLAAEGRFDEATHLLLQRSVGQIASLVGTVVTIEH